MTKDLFPLGYCGHNILSVTMILFPLGYYGHNKHSDCNYDHGSLVECHWIGASGFSYNFVMLLKCQSSIWIFSQIW